MTGALGMAIELRKVLGPFPLDWSEPSVAEVIEWLPTEHDHNDKGDPDLDVYANNCDACHTLRLIVEWLKKHDGIDNEAAIAHLEWLRGLRLETGAMAEVFDAGFTGVWGSVDAALGGNE